MSEKKFRGKRVNKVGVHIWAYGYYSRNRYGPVIWVEDEYGGWSDIPIIEGTQGQYTGLRDKNGKEIYEDDVVNAWFPSMPHHHTVRQEIMFVNGCFGCGNFPLSVMDLAFLEVIGNIYENPELLEVKP